jgi:hypothetical protein
MSAVQEEVGQAEDETCTFQFLDLSRLSIHSKLRFGKSSEAACVGLQNFLKNLAALLDNDLNRRAVGEQLEIIKRVKSTASNRPKSRGLHPAGTCSRTRWRQVSDWRKALKKSTKLSLVLGLNLGDCIPQVHKCTHGKLSPPI